MCIFCLSDVYIVLLSPDEILEQGRNASQKLSPYYIKLFSVYSLCFFNVTPWRWRKTVSKHVSITNIGVNLSEMFNFVVVLQN